MLLESVVAQPGLWRLGPSQPGVHMAVEVHALIAAQDVLDSRPTGSALVAGMGFQAWSERPIQPSHVVVDTADLDVVNQPLALPVTRPTLQTGTPRYQTHQAANVRPSAGAARIAGHPVLRGHVRV